MARIRAIKVSQQAPLPKWDEWRDEISAVVQDHGELAKTPWTRMCAYEIFPGCRLDSEIIEVPKAYMAAGTLQYQSARQFKPARAGIPANPELASFRDECVRRTLYALLLPRNSGRGIQENRPSTWKARASAYLRIAEWQFANCPSEDGSVFGAMTLADLLTRFYPEKGKTPSSKREYEMVLRALIELGNRKVISDYPRFFGEEPDEDAEAPLEPVRRGATVLRPADPAPEPTVEPFSDDFVTEFMRRALWIQHNLADGLVQHLIRDRDIRQGVADTGATIYTSAVSTERLEALDDGEWRDAGGRPLTRLAFPIRQLTQDGNIVFSDAWPPRDIKSFRMALGTLQGCNLGIVNGCTGARSSEILAADDVPFGERTGRYNSVTFKLVDEIGGRERDWPLHPAAERAIDHQRALSAIVRPAGEKQLWVTLKGEQGSRLSSATSVFARTVDYLGLTDRLGFGSAHMHRWRHTVARLVALSVVGAPKVLFDLFGHKDIEMTLHYMMSDPDIAEEAMRVAKETNYALVKKTIVETVAGETSGAAGVSLRENLPKAMRRGEDVFDTDSLQRTAQVLTFDGTYWQLVREGVICTKGLGQYGPCTKGRGTPDPGACRTSCDHRLETAMAKQQCAEALQALVRERQSAIADQRDLLVANLDGQIVAELKRWDEVREQVLAAHPDIRQLWGASSK